MKAILFDIDGTILKTNGAGKSSMKQACLDIYGTCGNMDIVNFQGKTDPLILKESLNDFGIEDEIIFSKIEEFKISYCYYLTKNIQNSNTILLPGITEILDNLEKNDSILIGLLTGNFECGAKIKLNHFELWDYFEVGIFSDSTYIRNDMPYKAVEIISDKYSIDIHTSDLIIIGDTIYDIECGKKAGALTISVGTGWTDKQTLLNHQPDYFFDDLSNTSLFLNLINDFIDNNLQKQLLKGEKCK